MSESLNQKIALYKMWPIKKYGMKKEDFTRFLEQGYEEYELEEKIEVLSTMDNGYHDRIHPQTYYKFFGDCDNYRGTMQDFTTLLLSFLVEAYGIHLIANDLKYTQNKAKRGSYHYVIPKLYAKTEKLKEIHSNFLTRHKDVFEYTDSSIQDKMIKVIDTSVYSEHWFRCPNQSKEGDKKSKHIIQVGEMKDFILDYIEQESECIDDKPYLLSAQTQVKTNKKNSKPIGQEVKEAKEEVEEEPIISQDKHVMRTLLQKSEWPVFYMFFDKCFAKKRFEMYEYWINVGMAIKNKYGAEGFELFKYFSNKASKPDCEEKLKSKYDSFKQHEKQLTISTIYYYAKEDNKEVYREIIKKHSPFKGFDMSSVAISKYIKMLKPNHFVWKNRVLYCFNGKYWVQNDLPLRIFIGNELYEFLKDLFVECFWESDKRTFDAMKKSIDKLKTIAFKKEIVETTEEDFTNNKMEFDSKWYLFGFDNVVLDLRSMTFRDYQFDDYILTTTGYDWVEPTQQQIKMVNDLIVSIHPQIEERSLYLEIMSTGLEGRSNEKFFVFNGKGGNGKGLTNDLALKGFGHYGLIANNAILFEKRKTGSNPEIANIHKKRFVIFREPPKKSKIENSIMKELTGGGKIAARGHHETATEKVLQNTTILECNDRVLFSEDPKEAELRRLIDLFFGTIFTDDKTLLDESRRIMPANVIYKDEDFQENHKYAFLKLMMEAYKGYQARNFKFDVPESVKNRTKAYLEMSSNIMNWINDEYEKTDNEDDYIKICDMFDAFKDSEHYANLTKSQKLQYNRRYFVDELQNNIFISRYIHAMKYIKGKLVRSVLVRYKAKTEEKYELEIDEEGQ